VSELRQILAFVDGAKTGIDWLNHKGRGKTSDPSEYEEGFRAALDAIGGFIDDIQSEAIEAGIK
jgi:hypothetical protein